MKNTIRWILMLPLMIAAWVATFYLAIMSLPLFEYLAEASGAPSDSAVKIAMVSGSSLSAFLVVGVAALVAPYKKVMFAWLALGLGGLVATAMYISLGVNFMAPYSGAILSGALTAGIVHWRLY